MVWKTKRKNGGMFRIIAKIGLPVGRTTLAIGKEYGEKVAWYNTGYIMIHL